MSELPGYDAWKLREPDAYAGDPPCGRCWHDAVDHGDYNDNDPMPNEYFEGCRVGTCECAGYTEEDPRETDERRAEARGHRV